MTSGGDWEEMLVGANPGCRAFVLSIHDRWTQADFRDAHEIEKGMAPYSAPLSELWAIDLAGLWALGIPDSEVLRLVEETLDALTVFGRKWGLFRYKARDWLMAKKQEQSA